MIGWVTSHCGVSTSTARQWVTTAARLESLPCLSEGLASGDLSLDLVSQLAEVATSETDAELREASAHWTVRQAREVAAWHKAQREANADQGQGKEPTAEAPPDADSDNDNDNDNDSDSDADADNGNDSDSDADADNDSGNDSDSDADADNDSGNDSGNDNGNDNDPRVSPVVGNAAREFERRTLRFNDTRRTVWIAFTKEDYSTFKSIMVVRAAAEKRDAETAERKERQYDEYVPYDQRLYDTLMHVIDRGARLDTVTSNRESAAGGNSRPPSGESADPSPGGGSPRDWRRPRLVIHAPIGLLVGLAPAADAGVAEIAGLGPVETEVLRRLACDADVDLSVESREGCILDQGRARRDPTTAQRIEIARRDKGCRFPGCVFTEFTDVHHIRHWAKGGETNLDNLVTLCDRHHKAVHELGWSVVGDPNVALSFTSPHGHEMKSVPSPTWRHVMSRTRSHPAHRRGQARRE